MYGATVFQAILSIGYFSHSFNGFPKKGAAFSFPQCIWFAKNDGCVYCERQSSWWGELEWFPTLLWLRIDGGSGEDWWSLWLVNKGNTTCLASKIKSNFFHRSKPHLVFWEPSKHPCFVVETQYHNTRSERLVLFLSRVVKHCKRGNKKLSAMW